MTKNEQRKIEKQLIDAVDQTTPGSADHKTAIEALLKFEQMCEETRKNKSSEELEQQKIDNDAEKLEVEKNKISSQEAVAAGQRLVDEEKLRQEKELAEKQTEIEEKRQKVEKKIAFWNFFGNIFGSVLGVGGTIGGTVLAYKLYDKQATKAYKFEETGTISSFTSKNVLSGMKPPKH